MSANRWSSYDTDSYRLPAGMVRSGYDADSQTYFFRDSSGQEYKSASGSEYGRLEKAGWDGGPLLPRTPRTNSASSMSSGMKSPATDFSEILSELEEENEEEGKDKAKAKSKPLPFLVLGSVMSFKSKLKPRRPRGDAEPSRRSSIWSKKEKDYL
ncbi:hypothetical protein MPH_04842 [Macrophomina phaseolina MS6]|uniref:Uncharacterized protein n=1 Tax=Macrophomina phaseolina (strain MS6) TaxID=1126212 RepID=K2RT04_MACPH|nr:hypothetical protein MPH_04842 [Macrophomina phaseolina MS6]